MGKSDFPDFYAILPSEGGKSFAWCGGIFAPGCDYLSSGGLKAELRKPGYEFCAHILAPCLNLFQQFTDARDFVRAELVDQIINGFFTGKSPTKEEIEREVAAHCTWFGEHEAQFRNGDAIADYKIEKMSLPRKAQKGE